MLISMIAYMIESDRWNIQSAMNWNGIKLFHPTSDQVD